MAEQHRIPARPTPTLLSEIVLAIEELRDREEKVYAIATGGAAHAFWKDGHGEPIDPTSGEIFNVIENMTLGPQAARVHRRVRPGAPSEAHRCGPFGASSMSAAVESPLDLIDEIQARLTKARAICAAVKGAASSTDPLPDDAIPESMWAVRDMLDEVGELALKLHQYGDRPLALRS